MLRSVSESESLLLLLLLLLLATAILRVVCSLCSTIPAATPTLSESNPGGRGLIGGMVRRVVQDRLSSLRTP